MSQNHMGNHLMLLPPGQRASGFEDLAGQVQLGCRRYPEDSSRQRLRAVQNKELYLHDGLKLSCGNRGA